MKARHYLTQIFGLHAAFVPLRGFIGNCFSPAIVVEHRSNQRGQHAQWTLTLRTSRTETTVYWDGRLDFWCNSAHLARWFGKFHDTDFGGYHEWCGHLDL